MIISQYDYDEVKEAFVSCHGEYCSNSKDFEDCPNHSCIARRLVLRHLEGEANEVPATIS